MGKALDARDALESSRAKYWVPTGVFEIAIAILTLTTSIAVTTAYALFMLGSAVMIGLSQFMHGRRTTRRAASLESSRPSDASQWLALFPQLSVLASLAFLDVAPVGSVLIALAGSAILALAYSVLRNPSFAAGDDPIVERYIDSRLRSLRFVLIAAAATAPAFLFCLLTELASPHTLLHLSAMLVAQGSFVAMMIAQIAFVIARSLEDRAGRWWTKAGSA